MSRNRSFKRNASSVILSDDDDGLESEVIYTTNELSMMYRGPRYEEPFHDDHGDGHGQDGNTAKKPKRVTFFRNGDRHFKGKEVLISQRNYANFEALLIDLSETITMVTGVHHIFSYPAGKEIKSLKEFENGQAYIVSSTKKVDKTVEYGKSSEGYWQNAKPKHDERHLFKGKNTQVESGSSASHSATSSKPIKVTVISNLQRDSRNIILLNPKTEVNFEDILEDIPQMVMVPYPPVLSLWTARKPMEKVESFSRLMSLFRNNHTDFYAVGQEGVPMEMDTVKRRQMPVSDSDDSLNDRRKMAGLSQQDALISNSVATGLNRRGGSYKEKKFNEASRVTINGKPREFFPPSYIDGEDDGKKPNKKLKLDWIYGFRGRDIQDNLKVLITGELMYFVATVVVIYEKKDSRYQDKSKPSTDGQRHYTGHNEEVTCLAIHPNKRFVASGQLAGNSPEFAAHVRIWDGITLTTYQVIGYDLFKAGVNTVAFCEDMESKYVMVIDESDKHVLSVWDWNKPKLIAKTTTTSEAVKSGYFYKDDIMITYGNKHLYFWKLFFETATDKSKILRDKKSGVFEDEVPNVTSLTTTLDGGIITGNSDGSMHVWINEENDDIFILSQLLSDKLKSAHKGPVNALCMMMDGTLLSGGGNEIKAWDSQSGYKFVKEKMLPELAGGVRAIIPQNPESQDGIVYIGTTKSCIMQGEKLQKFQYVLQGHCDEVWAIANHPKQPSFITAGHDQLVIKWSTLSHGIMWKTQIEKPCVSVAINPMGTLVAVGTTVGRLVLLRADDGTEVTATQVGVAQINALNFSPDNKMLAIGAHDGFIHVFSINEKGQFYRTQSAGLKNNSAFVSQVDWSIDSKYLQTVLGDYEVIYWDVFNMQKKKDPRIMKDAESFTQTCSVGYPLIGPWTNLAAKEVINVASRSVCGEFLAVGDNRGRIRLYKYPSSTPNAQFRNVKAYSNNVTAITFTADDSYVLTSGGNDAALFQWVLSDLNAQ